MAGNGTAGYSGDEEPAVSAELGSPSGVAVDSSGNIYIADQQNNRIRKVDTSGVITTVAGNGTAGYSGDGGPATSAELDDPSGVAVDASGNLYIADSLNSVIRKVSPSGIITTVAGNGYNRLGTGQPAFNDGGYSGDGGPATTAELNNPYAVAVDASGNLYIADTYNHRIRKVDTSGVITTVAGNGYGAPETWGATPATGGRPPAPNWPSPSAWPWTVPAISTSPIRTTTASARWTLPESSPPWSAAASARREQPGRRGRGHMPATSTSPTWATNASARWTPPALFTTVAGSIGNPGYSGDGGSGHCRRAQFSLRSGRGRLRQHHYR